MPTPPRPLAVRPGLPASDGHPGSAPATPRLPQPNGAAATRPGRGPSSAPGPGPAGAPPTDAQPAVFRARRQPASGQPLPPRLAAPLVPAPAGGTPAGRSPLGSQPAGRPPRPGA